MKRYLLTASILAFGILLIYLTQDIQLESLIDALSRIGWGLFFVALGLSYLQLIFQSSRLWSVTPKPKSLSWLKAADSFVTGQFINTFTPARGGEAVKIGMINQAQVKPLSHTAGIILSDTVLNVLAMVTLLIVTGMPLSTFDPFLTEFSSLDMSSTYLGIGVIILLVGCAFFIFRKRLIQSLINALSGMKGLIRPSQLGMGIVFAIFVWLIEALLIMMLVNSGIVSITLSQSLWVLILLNLSIAIPISIANIGIYEAAIIFGLKQFGISFEMALAVGLIYHAAQIISVYTVFLSFRLNQFIRRDRHEQQAPSLFP
jgi:glycosyltransferase 2 family protein